MSTENTIQSRDDFTDDASGWAKRWATEFEAARKWMASFFDSSAVSVERFLDKRDERMPDGQQRPDDEKRSRVNLYWANVVTQRAMLYGRVPEVDVSRRFDDANDDEARIGGPVILQRLLNTDIEKDEDGYRRVLRHSLSDFLTMGLATARVRYVCELEGVKKPAIKDRKGRTAPAVDGRKKKRDANGLPIEDVVLDYMHWRDQLWSPCRIFEDMRWWTFGTPMSQDEVGKRFGKDVARKLSYTIKTINTGGRQAGESNEDPKRMDPWQRVCVWEIWSKEEGKVFWYVEGYAEVLDVRDDPYKLRGFWPFPEPLMANLTTEAFLPRSDYAMAQDLYNDINEQSTRIALLERALKVAGVYDQSCVGLERLITEGYDNVLIPIEKWPAFQEKGGIGGAISWLPLDQVVAALDKLRDQRTETRQLLYEVTAQSDLMRGQEMDTGGSATAAAGKMRFGSVRLQHRQDEFARWASALQCLRAELITKLFEPETIAHRANVEHTEDRAGAMQAIRMLKEEYPNYRVEVKPEAIAQQDFAALKAERLEMLTAVGGLAQSATAMTQVLGPGAMPVFVELAKWAVASLRGGASIEGVFDKALMQAQQAAAQMAQGGGQPPPDPKGQAKIQQQQMKAQADAAKTQAELQADLARTQAETQAATQQQEAQYRFNVAEAEASERVKVQGEAQRARIRQATQPAPAAKAPTRRRP